MSTKTVELDEEAYEILSRQKRTGQSFSEVIKERLGDEKKGQIRTARDLLEYIKNVKIPEEALDRMEEVVQSRRQSPARIVDL